MAEDKFDPLVSRVSASPIRDLRSIARRARTILASKPTSAVRQAQGEIRDFRQVAFEAELDSAVDEEQFRLRHRALFEGDEDAARFFEIIVDGRGEVHCTFHRGMEEDLENLPSIDDRTRLESVLEFIEVALPLDRDSLSDWTASDFLAAHALALVEDAERQLMYAAEPSEEDLQALRLTSDLAEAANALQRFRKLDEVPAPNWLELYVREAFSLALEALDSVAKAEFQRALCAAEDLRRQLAGQVSSAKEEATIERDKRRLAARAALTQRHARTRELKEEILREWDADPSRFPSAERAGEHFADWLESRGSLYQQRTVRDWIRAHAKKKGVVLR